MSILVRSITLLALCVASIPLHADDALDSLFGTSSLLPSSQSSLLVSVFDKPNPETHHDLLTLQQAVAKVAADVLPATVGIELQPGRSHERAMGSGVVISADGLILTAAHVISEPDRQVIVRFPDGRTARAVSLGLHTRADGGMVKIVEEGPWPFVPVIDKSNAPDVGQWCVATGHPRGFQKDRSPPVRLGRVVDISDNVLRTDCTITGGDSGGPLFDMQGRVIGIHSRITQSFTENYHVPALAFREAWDVMKAGGLYPKPVPSKFLAILDANGDGQLSRSEQTSEYRRGVFDRLVKSFQLEEQESLSIEKIAIDKFNWGRGQVRMDDVDDLLGDGRVALSSRYFVRGSVMSKLVGRATSSRSPEASHASGLVSDSTLGRKGGKGIGEIFKERKVSVGKGAGQAFPIKIANPVAGKSADPPLRRSTGHGGHKASKRITVRVYGDGDRVALGTIVDANGIIVTKASSLNGKQLVECSLPNGQRKQAKIHAIDDEYDLALLKVEADALAVPQWANSDLELGQWAILPTTSGRIESLGVVSVAPRKIARARPMLGIEIDPRIINEAQVVRVFPKSGAAEAGIQAKDSIVNMAGERVFSLKDIKDALGEFRPGDIVKAKVDRGGDIIELEILLSTLEDILSSTDTWRMSGPLSRRRDDFESVLQIDATLKPNACGGPVLNIMGEFVGITIARADRVSTYAIDAETVRQIVTKHAVAIPTEK